MEELRIPMHELSELLHVCLGIEENKSFLSRSVILDIQGLVNYISKK